jgi:hypothetical protein
MAPKIDVPWSHCQRLPNETIALAVDAGLDG